MHLLCFYLASTMHLLCFYHASALLLPCIYFASNLHLPCICLILTCICFASTVHLFAFNLHLPGINFDDFRSHVFRANLVHLFLYGSPTCQVLYLLSISMMYHIIIKMFVVTYIIKHLANVHLNTSRREKPG